MQYTYKNKPRKCPVCGSKRVVRILYGLPAPEVFDDVEKGKIALGGCCITDNDPYWKCLDCDTEIYKCKPIMKLNKPLLGISAKHCVAAELGRRNILAEFKDEKKNEIVINSEISSETFIVYVRSKQGNEWPGVKGINNSDSFLVFVDFEGISINQRPSYYILGMEDWYNLILERKAEYEKKHPGGRVKIIDNVIIFMDEINPSGKPYKGCGIKPSQIKPFKEKWQKITKRIYNQ